MRFCLALIILLLVLGFAGVTVAFNVFSNQSLDFELKDDPEKFINTRRSYRPMSTETTDL